MKKWQEILENRYNYLLATEVLIIFAYPILNAYDRQFPFTALLLLIALIPALYVALKPRTFLYVMGFGLFAFILNLVIKYQADRFTEHAWFALVAVYSVYLLLAIVILLKRLGTRIVVTSDMIKGGISVYILIGFLWMMFYLMLLILNKDALSNISNPGMDSFYYSFTTMTTLGYGDIAPMTTYAKILAVTEAAIGPIYIAIFIAQLVALNMVSRLREHE